MTESFQLDGLTMNAVRTAPNGVVGPETIFEFRQEGDLVQASYAGGRVAAGHLIGRLRGDRLEFRYCQTHADGGLDGGRSECELRRSEAGLVQIVERFAWDGGTGTNVIQEWRRP